MAVPFLPPGCGSVLMPKKITQTGAGSDLKGAPSYQATPTGEIKNQIWTSPTHELRSRKAENGLICRNHRNSPFFVSSGKNVRLYSRVKLSCHELMVGGPLWQRNDGKQSLVSVCSYICLKESCEGSGLSTRKSSQGSCPFFIIQNSVVAHVITC